MNYLLLQLQFNTPVHFGGNDSASTLSQSADHFLADTLFSALCHTALQLHGEEGVHLLVERCKSGQFLLSDAMPWKDDRYYVPKPYHAALTTTEISSGQRKALKKMQWIPAQDFTEYEQCLASGKLYSGDGAVFGQTETVEKASVPETGDAEPYPIGLYHFLDDCGLYVIIGVEKEEDAEWLLELLEALGYSGIGGKTSAGYGKFTVIDTVDLSEPFDDQTKWLSEALSGTAEHYMLLSSSLPKDDELDRIIKDASFHIVRRGGFVTSDTFADTNRKKQTQYFLKAGSIVKYRFQGDVFSVGGSGRHPVYRYAKPIFLGVNL